MALDFPDNPSLNQIFVTSRATYRWDGAKWTPYAGVFTDAPADNFLYGRLNLNWVKALPLAGGTLTGPLTLNADPTTANGAATKHYVDSVVASGGIVFAAPSAQIGLTAITGSATSAVRSDAAPALSQAIVPVWTGKHAFSAGLTSANLVDVAGTIRSTAQTVPASGAGLELIYAGGVGYIQPIDRAGPTYKPLTVQAASTTFSSPAGAGSGNVVINSTTGSSSTSDGALVVNGGAGIAGACNVGLLTAGANSKINGSLGINNVIYNYSGTCNLAAVTQTLNSGNNIFYDSGNGPALQANNTNNVFRNANHYLYSRDGGTLFAQFNSAGEYLNGQLFIANAIKNYATTVTLATVTQTLNSGSNVIYDAGNGPALQLTNANIVFRNTTYNFQDRAGTVNWAILNSSNLNTTVPITCGGYGSFNGNVLINGPIVNYNGNCNLASVTNAVNSGYNQIYDSSNRVAILVGGTADPTIYLRDTNIYLQGPGGSPNMLLAGASGINIPIGTASTSPTTGALTVTGGVGVQGNIFSGYIQAKSTTWSGQFVNPSAAAGAAGIYVAAGATPATNDTQTLYTAWTDVGVTTYNGYICRNGPNAVAYVTGSDARDKVTINEQSEIGLDTLRQIKVRDFYWANDENETLVHGLYAQDVIDFYPDAVAHPRFIDADGKTTDDIAWGIDYGRLSPLAIRAVQQLADKVDQLTAQVAALMAA